MARTETPGEGLSQNNLVRSVVNPLTGGIELSLGGSGSSSLPNAKGRTAALLGDSFSARNTVVNTLNRYLDYGYFPWTQALMGAPFSLILNAGVSGERTDQMLLRVSTVISAKPSWCFVQGGINDINASVAVSTIVANLKTICTTLINNGINVVLLTLNPNNQAAGNSLKVQQVNQALREWGLTNRQEVTLVDTYSACVNPLVTTGALASGMSDDSLHPSAKGAWAMGVAIAAALTPKIAPIKFLPSSAAESYSVDSTCKQILDNPLMIGVGAAATGTGASGTVPLGWAGGVSGSTASAAFSQVARSDGFGNDAQIVVTGAASGTSVNIRQTSLLARGAIGDTVYVVGQVTISGASDLKTIGLGGSAIIDSVTHQFNCLENGGSTNVNQGDMTLTFKSEDFTLTGTSLTSLSFVASIVFGTSAAGAVTVKFGRCGMYKK